MILYYFSTAYFYALPLNIISLLILVLYLKDWSYNYRLKLTGILLTLIIIPVPISTPAINYNFKIITYPYQFSTWTGKQWLQTHKMGSCKIGNIFKDVYQPSRLRVLDTCITVEGIVTSEPTMGDDRDIFFDLKPDKEYSHMLSIGSIIIRKGNIHIEIVPADQGHVIIPDKGDKIRVTGVWVVDTNHGSWSEIHPAWNILIIP